MGAKIEDHGWDVTQYTAIKNKALLVQPDRYRQLLGAEKELAERDKLVEQMREALVAADGLIDEYAADYEHRDNVDEIRDGIKAALSAAERGKS